MKNLLLLITCVLLTAQSGVSQTPSESETQKLNQEIAVLYQKGDFEKAISRAEKLVEISSESGNEQNLATATLNLAILRKERFQLNLNRVRSPQMPVREKAALVKSKILEEDGAAAEKLFNRVIEIHQNELKTDTPQLATAKNELAWITYNYFASGVDEDDTAQEKTVKARSRIDVAEKYFIEAQALREKLLGAEHDDTLMTILHFGDFYKQYVNFEKALPFYERYLEAKEKRYGKIHKDLVPALRSYTEILVTTSQEAKAAERVKQLQQITGENISTPKADENISLRITRSELARVQQIPIKEDIRKRYKKRIPIQITIDEEGKVSEAVARADNAKVKAKAEEFARGIKYRAFVYDDTPRKMRGVVYFSEAMFRD
jgi:tetratricopeptide (TPR) repeat protein